MVGLKTTLSLLFTPPVHRSTKYKNPLCFEGATTELPASHPQLLGIISFLATQDAGSNETINETTQISQEEFRQIGKKST